MNSFLEGIAIRTFFIGGLLYVETEDGKHYIWGNVGELAGTRYIKNMKKPKEVNFTIKKCIRVEQTYYILTDIGLYAWGENYYGQTGNGTVGKKVVTPTKVKLADNIKEVITGSTVYAIMENGELYAWGKNDHSQVGNYKLFCDGISTPTKVNIAGNVKKVITGRTIYAITESGELYAWGKNKHGQVGDGYSGRDVLSPSKIELEGSVKEIITSPHNDKTVYAITENGELYAWGKNKHGQVGNGTLDKRVKRPAKVTLAGNIKEIITGSTVYIITENGELYAWGKNNCGQVGNGTLDECVTIPAKVEIAGSVKKIITSYNGSTAYAITENGELYAWGKNKHGQVGNGTLDECITIPAKVEIAGNVKEVIPSYNGKAVYAIMENGGFYTWGRNNEGCLVPIGRSSSVDKYILTPRIIENHFVGNVKKVIAGPTAFAIMEDGGLYVWGKNYYSQAGLRCVSGGVAVPLKVELAGNVKEIIPSSDYKTIYAITEKGELYAWGKNNYGQVGNGTSKTRVWEPAKIKIAGNIKEVIAGSTVYARTDTGKLYAWGKNEYGQVCNGTPGEKVTTPHRVREK